MCLPVAGTLPASRTHAARRWSFIASPDATLPGVGTVTLIQGKRDVTTYGVAVEDGDVLFAKLDGSNVYGVTLDRLGHPVRCTCDGWHFGKAGRKHCRHVDATRELIAEGIVCTAPATIAAA